VVICPSNPYLSIDPILAMPELRRALSLCRAPVIAVSPVVGGRAVKGPTAKMMRELGLAVSNEVVARHYAGLIDGLVVDERDADSIASVDIPTLVTRSLMVSLEDREDLARAALEFAVQVSPAVRARRAS
jgi:LPPG:FO 2-phospho-L-lactate transferase